ncbi:MAG: histidinol-phosphatase HisJ family protein [Firmicutes bacterium]|nr:histidinol-phosphatase HisJ family protein [Bacillota bacterium]
MQALFDFHTHSIHSYDATATFDELCKNALKKGLQGICVTDHMDFDKKDPGYGYYNYDAYMKDVNRCREIYGDRLLIKTGVEITYQKEFKDKIKQFLGNHKFDYVLGAVHLIDHVFFLNPEYILGKTINEIFEPYWQEVLSMARSSLFRYIAHLDFIKSVEFKDSREFRVNDWMPEITEILENIIESDAILEVNTSALRRRHTGPYPGWAILKRYKELGGTCVAMGSDAHSAQHVGFGFKETARRVRELGLKILRKQDV